MFVLSILLLSLFSLSQQVVDQIRMTAVASLSYLIPTRPRKAATSSEAQECKSLQLENQQLRAQLDLVYEWLGSEKRWKEQIDQLQTIYQDTSLSKKILDRRSKEMKSLLQRKAIAAFGNVIYRDPSAWSSSCWIDVGEENNAALGQTIVAKNSPIVSGSALVGVVEYVGKRQSRVRLISDAGLKAAVRAVRGSILDREIASLSHQLLQTLQKHPGLQSHSLVSQLTQFTTECPIRWEDGYFAKGEIVGSGAAHYRSLQMTLRGVGFNYEFPDEEGPSRDLRANLLQVGDVLITSGLDGVFPPGLKVGVITHVHPLKTGAFSYELEAIPVAGDLADLTTVSILPPVGIDE